MSQSKEHINKLDVLGPLSRVWRLSDLPEDVIIHVLDFLGVTDLSRLSRTSHHMKELIDNYGWSSYFRLHRLSSSSLSCVENIWTPYESLKYDTLSAQSWENRQFVARPLSVPWPRRYLPVLAISRTRFVVAAGSKLYVYLFTRGRERLDVPKLNLEATYTITRDDITPDARHDITAISFLPDSDSGQDRTLLAGFADGIVMNITLPEKIADIESLKGKLTQKFLYQEESSVVSLSVSQSSTLTIAGTGQVRLKRKGHISHLHLNVRSWSAQFSTVASPYATFGTSSATPLVTHAIREDGLSSKPSTILGVGGMNNFDNDVMPRMSSAVYGIASTPLSFPASSAQVIVSGWYDGLVRLYDLRSSRRKHNPSGRPSTLSPVMSFHDPWSFEPIYTVDCGGSTGSTIAAGSARHSVVAFWDVRYPKSSAGWSVHAPGNDRSPVYSMILDGSRLYGASQSRPFVLDFGPNVKEETYPTVHSVRGDGLKKVDGHYKVTVYSHSSWSD